MFLRFVLCGLALVVALDPDPEPGNVLSSGNEPPSGTPLTTVETTPDADSRTVLAVPAVPPSDPPATYGSTGDLLLPQQNTPVVVIEESDDPAPAKSWTRWLWWLLIVYMFYCQATICDEYFVEAIKVVVERFKIPEDVAGATLMALGCNGPELFTNFIAIFITHSAVGVGTIVGSEIFNLLCIVGGSIVCCPKLPLLLEKPPFIRDCAFYGVSIVMLQFTLRDGLVTLPEALTLLAMCGVYATSVAMTAPFLEWWEKRNGGGGSAVAGKFLS